MSTSTNPCETQNDRLGINWTKPHCANVRVNICRQRWYHFLTKAIPSMNWLFLVLFFQEDSGSSDTILVSSGSDAGTGVTARSELWGVTKLSHLSSCNLSACSKTHRWLIYVEQHHTWRLLWFLCSCWFQVRAAFFKGCTHCFVLVWLHLKPQQRHDLKERRIINTSRPDEDPTLVACDSSALSEAGQKHMVHAGSDSHECASVSLLSMPFAGGAASAGKQPIKGLFQATKQLQQLWRSSEQIETELHQVQHLCHHLI